MPDALRTTGTEESHAEGEPGGRARERMAIEQNDLVRIAFHDRRTVGFSGLVLGAHSSQSTRWSAVRQTL